MGKTSLLNVIYGLVNIKGELRFSDDALRERMSLIPVRAANIDSLSAEDNLLLVEKDRSKVKVAMERLSLWDKRKRVASQLSLGEQQRLSMARALLQPDIQVFLFDEPSANLDRKSSEKAFQILKEISQRAIVVVATHDVDLAERYADAFYEVLDGQVKEKKREEVAEEIPAAPEKPKGACAPYLRFGMRKAFRKPWLSIVGSLLTVIGTMVSAYSFSLGSTTKNDITKGMLASFREPYLIIDNFTTVFDLDPDEALKRYDGSVYPSFTLNIESIPFTNGHAIAREDLGIEIQDESQIRVTLQAPRANAKGEIEKGLVAYPIYLSHRTREIIESSIGSPLSFGDVISTNATRLAYHTESFLFAGEFDGHDEKAVSLKECHPFIINRADFQTSSRSLGDSLTDASSEFYHIACDFNTYMIEQGRPDIAFNLNEATLSNNAAFSAIDLPFAVNEGDDPSLPTVRYFGKQPSELGEGEILIPSKEFYRCFGQNSQSLFPEMAEFKQEYATFYGKYLYEFAFGGDGKYGFYQNVYPDYRLRSYRIVGYYEVMSPAKRDDQGEYIQEEGGWARTAISTKELPILISETLKAKIEDWRYAHRGAFSGILLIERSYAIEHPELLAWNFDIASILNPRNIMWEEQNQRQKIFPWIGLGSLSVSLLFAIFSLLFLEKDIAGAYRKSRKWARKLPAWPTIASLTLFHAGLSSFFGATIGYIAWVFFGSRPRVGSIEVSLSVQPTIYLLTFLVFALVSFLFGTLFYAIYQAQGKKGDNA